MPPRQPPTQRSRILIPPADPTPIATIQEVVESEPESEPTVKTSSPPKPAFESPVVEENIPQESASSKGKRREPDPIPFYPIPTESFRQPSEPFRLKSPSMQPSIQSEDFITALKGVTLKSKSDAGKIKVPEPFTGKDPKKLKAFIFQCQLYFRSSTDFEDDSKKVTFGLSYLRDLAQEWFEPGISGLTEEPPDWLDDWEAFVDELRTNFGPYNEIGDAESELTNLRMKDNQRISDYLVKFTSLAVRCPWGDAALRYRFYEGLPPRMKDELSKGEGKPRTLREMKIKSQNIDARYWERVQERTRESKQTQSTNPTKSANPTASASTPTSTSQKSKSASGSGSEQKSSKPKDSKPTTPRVDLTGKLDSRGKLTQQERQRRIDKNLCLFCGGSGHRTDTCPVKASSVKARASTTTSESVPTSAKPKPKESGSDTKKD